jgi:hypothetical protein
MKTNRYFHEKSTFYEKIFLSLFACLCKACKIATDNINAYSYLGDATVINVLYPESNVMQSYLQYDKTPIGDGGDQYDGLDRRWEKFASRQPLLNHANLKLNNLTMSLKISKESLVKKLKMFVLSNIAFLFLCSCVCQDETKTVDAGKKAMSFFKSKVSFFRFILDISMKPNAVYPVSVYDMEDDGYNKIRFIKSDNAKRKLITLLRNATISPQKYPDRSTDEDPERVPFVKPICSFYNVNIFTDFLESDESFGTNLLVHKRTAEITISMPYDKGSKYKIDETSHKKILEFLEEQTRESPSNQQDGNNENK